MKKLFKILPFFLCIFLITSGSAMALSFTFGPQSDEGGTGIAEMDIDIVGNMLTAYVRNTSPTDLDGAVSGTGGNTPGITGFGFDLDPDGLSLQSWTLEAYNIVGTEVTVGTGSPGDDWKLGTTMAGITVDYLPSTQGENIDGALFNPLAKDDTNNELPGGSNTNYFTEATLTMTFDVDDEPLLAPGEWSPFVRMQNVGIDGEGSLKLQPVPEPSTMVISSLFLLGAGLYVRRKLHS